MKLTLQGPCPSETLIQQLCVAAGSTTILPGSKNETCFLHAQRTPEFDSLIPSIDAEMLDWAFIEQGKKLSDFGLICFDMDSTLITIECIDELADFAQKKDEVSHITEQAMAGKIDYRESLRRRLSLLAGLDANVLARVYNERLQLSPGVPTLLKAAQDAGLRTAILSGGFTYFTERLRIELGFDFATSNRLEISGGKLTGKIVGDIIDASAKAHHLARLADELGLKNEQVIACGDGANDLMMLSYAGLSVAYKAKSAVRSKADVAINFGRLDSLLNLFDS